MLHIEHPVRKVHFKKRSVEVEKPSQVKQNNTLEEAQVASHPLPVSNISYNFIEIFNRDKGFSNKMKLLKSSLRNLNKIDVQNNKKAKENIQVYLSRLNRVKTEADDTEEDERL